MTKSNERTAMRAGRNSIAVNVALSSFKLFAGIFANSAAMISDAVHSITDLFGTVIALVGIKLGNKAPDSSHQYGHDRFESVATLVLAALILSVGVGIGWVGVNRIIEGDFTETDIPGVLALVAAVVSIAVKEALFWYMRYNAKKVNSSALMADAWHSRIDGLSSVGSFVGILAAMLGFAVMDSVAAVIISLFIIKAAVSIGIDALGKMTDRACDAATVAEMRALILSQDSVDGIDELKTRLFGNKIYVDVEINIDGAKTLHEAHEIAHVVHDAIEHSFKNVKHCTVHVNPTHAIYSESSIEAENNRN